MHTHTWLCVVTALCETSIKPEKNYHTIGQTRGKSHKHCCRRRIDLISKNVTAQAYSGLRSDNHSPLWWTELGSEDIRCPEGPGPSLLPALPSIFLALQEELHFITNTLGPQEKVPRPRPQAVIGSAKYVPGFEKELCHSPSMRAS